MKGGHIATFPYKPGFGRGRGPIKREAEHRINDKIKATHVRLVGDTGEPQVLSIDEALKMAADAGLDLVEIAAQADPPVCKIVDYQKFLYERKKKEKETKAKASKQILKEIRFGPNTDEHDFNFKVKHAQKFLEDGAKVKAYVHFRGRAIAYKARGEIILLKFAQALEDVGKVEMLPKLEGNRMFLHLAPLPNKKSSKPTKTADEKVADKPNAKKSAVEATPKKSADIPFPEQIADESENNNEA